MVGIRFSMFAGSFLWNAPMVQWNQKNLHQEVIFLEDKIHKVSGGPQLLLAENGVGLFSTVLRYGTGLEKRLPAVTPAEDLIAATEIDYREYRREIK